MFVGIRQQYQSSCQNKIDKCDAICDSSLTIQSLKTFLDWKEMKSLEIFPGRPTDVISQPLPPYSYRIPMSYDLEEDKNSIAEASGRECGKKDEMRLLFVKDLEDLKKYSSTIRAKSSSSFYRIQKQKWLLK